MKTSTELEIFINRFAFNKDADIQYLVQGFLMENSYIELLRASITKLIRSQKDYKKILTTIKIKTDRNAKKYNEAYDNLEIDFLRMVNLLKDSHHFFVNIFKIELLSKQNISGEEMHRKFSDVTLGFTDLIQQIEFSKEERFILNTFNRMRNIIIHAPSQIILGYLTVNVLEQFKICVNLSIGVANNIITRIKESIYEIVKIQQENIEKKENPGIENVESYAAKYNLTINELLEIIKKSDYDFSVEIHRDMELDGYSKEAIAPMIEEFVKEKEKQKKEAEFQNHLSSLYDSNSFMTVDFDYVLSLSNNDIDKAYNHIYEVYVNCKAKQLAVYSSSSSKEVLQAIEELHYATNNKQKIAKNCNEVLKNTLSSKNIDALITYVGSETRTCFDEYECRKYLIVKSKDDLSNDEPINWTKIVMKKSKIVNIY